MSAAPSHGYYTRRASNTLDLAEPQNDERINPYSRQYKKVVVRKTLPRAPHRKPNRPKGFGWSSYSEEDAEVAALFTPEFDETYNLFPASMDFLTFGHPSEFGEHKNVWYNNSKSELSSFDEAQDEMMDF